jgi:serine/threonine protein kinase
MLAMVTEVTSEGYTAMVDYWSLGVTMHKLLTGKMPFHNAHLSSFVDYVVKTPDQRVITMPDYLAEFNSFIMSLMETAKIATNTASVIFRFLAINYHDRLGYGDNGVAKIQAHEYFEDLEWNKLAQKHVEPPYIPVARDDAVENRNPSSAMFCHESFEQMLKSIDIEKWDLNTPQPMQQEYFSNWYVTFFFMVNMCCEVSFIVFYCCGRM